MHNYKELTVWQKSMDLTVFVYQISKEFHSEEKFNLVSQINRSAVSVPSNIAEGAGRNSDKEFLHFLNIANGSSYELETQLLLAERLGFISVAKCSEVKSLLSEIQRMLFLLQKKLKSEKFNY